MGKLSLVGGCSSYSGFDGSVGSVSSFMSQYSQVWLEMICFLYFIFTHLYSRIQVVVWTQ